MEALLLGAEQLIEDLERELEVFLQAVDGAKQGKE